MRNVYLSKHFRKFELSCKDSKKLLLRKGFLESLEDLRKRFNRPMIITSCCRSTEYNKKIGGAKQSFHICDSPYNTGCCAVDIYCDSKDYQLNLLQLAWSTGWSVGLYSNFLHLDRRSDYTNNGQKFFIGR